MRRPSSFDRRSHRSGLGLRARFIERHGLAAHHAFRGAQSPPRTLVQDHAVLPGNIGHEDFDGLFSFLLLGIDPRNEAVQSHPSPSLAFTGVRHYRSIRYQLIFFSSYVG